MSSIATDFERRYGYVLEWGQGSGPAQVGASVFDSLEHALYSLTDTCTLDVNAQGELCVFPPKYQRDSLLLQRVCHRAWVQLVPLQTMPSRRTHASLCQARAAMRCQGKLVKR